MAGQRAQIAAFGDPVGGRRSRPARSAAARPRRPSAAAPRPAPAPPRVRASRCNRRACRPAAGFRARRAADCPARPTAVTTSSGCFRCGTSGWRRIAPVAVHGASSSTASTGRSGRQVSASAANGRHRQAEPVEVRDEAVEAAGRAVDRRHQRPGAGELRGLAARRGAQIDDVETLRADRTAAPAARRPRPGSTRRPRHSRAAPSPSLLRHGAASRSAAWSPAVSRTRDRCPRRRAASRRAAPPSDARRRSRAPGPRHRRRPRTATAIRACSGGRRPGVSTRPCPSTLSRRSTALTRPLCDRKPRECARSTLVATAACGGVRRNSNCAMPSRSTSWMTAARGASGVLRHSPISASICPSRRSTVATSSRAKARSRTDRSPITGWSSIASSSGRLRRSTAPIRSRATCRAFDAAALRGALGNGDSRELPEEVKVLS